MEEKKIVKFKKDEFAVKEYIKKNIGKGKISKVKIEYTPIGEKIIVSTNRPGMVIGRGGEKISELTHTLKTRFKLENPQIEIDNIETPELDAQIVADEIALAIERLGPLKFKVISYKALQKVMHAGALGCEIRLGGKLPSARAKTWLFSQGYLKKTGDSAKVVDRAESKAQTNPGTVGIKVAILSPYVELKDKIVINEEMINTLKLNQETMILEDLSKKKTKLKKLRKE